MKKKKPHGGFEQVLELYLMKDHRSIAVIERKQENHLYFVDFTYVEST